MNSSMIEIRPLPIVFYKTSAGNEPVREWLKGLDKKIRKIIGDDINTVQFGWPLGMPLVRSLGGGLWEVRSTLVNTIARVIFTVDNGKIILIHALIKKSQKMPQTDLLLARKRLRDAQ